MPKYNPKIVCAYFKECGLPPPEMEYQFNGDRKFRFDFSWPLYMVALEVEGGVFIRGAHGSISGIKRDMEKYNLAASMGWLVIRVTPDQVCMQDTVNLIKMTIISS
jgi:very-short-patch-repair endonuclease